MKLRYQRNSVTERDDRAPGRMSRFCSRGGGCLEFAPLSPPPGNQRRRTRFVSYSVARDNRVDVQPEGIGLRRGLGGTLTKKPVEAEKTTPN